jgi:LysM repeat protein
MYLLFNSGCMNQLEYRYAYSGAQVLAYSIKPTPHQQFVLHSGSNGINSPSLPPGTLDCSTMKLDQAFMDAINKNQKQVYMVHQTQSGYLMMPLISALLVERNGSYFFFRGANYQFALDTTNLVYQANLSSAGSPNYVYFTGLQIKDCVYQYSFRSEPVQAGREKADFDFIPGIGMVSERTGQTTTEMESNQTRLWFVNGMSVDDYVSTLCGTQGAPKVLPPDMVDYTKPDKEKAPAGTPPPATQAGVRCQEVSGPGYHIVQPKETLMSISRQYKVPVANLTKWNKITEPNKIEICQKVYVVDPATIKPVSTGTPPATTSPQPISTTVPVGPPTSQPAPTTITPEPQQPRSTAMPTIHVVKPGETVSGIARQYNYTEAQFRQINGFPATGNITIYPGQKLLVSEAGQPAPQAPVLSNYVPGPAAATQPVSTTTPPPATTTQPPAAAAPKPTEFNSFTPPPPSQQGATMPPVDNNQFISTPVTGGNVTPAAQQPPSKVTYYQEYVVQQGDTMNSIAVKFKTSAQELSLLNNKDVNETLIAGQRMLIPKQ